MIEEKMPLYLFKFGEYEYMKKLYEEGELFFNTIYYFKKLEDENLRGDKNENLSHCLQSSSTKIIINNEIINTTGSIKIYNPYKDNFNFTHIFSMSSLYDEETLDFDHRIKQFGDSSIIIYNIQEFFFRLKKGLDKIIDIGYLESFNYNKVKYYDLDIHHGKLDVFSKSHKYSFQKEWRLGLRLSNNNSEPYSLKIGDLTDIAKIVKTEDYLNGKIKYD